MSRKETELTIKVKFNNPDEFLAEMDKDKPDRGIVRLTFLYRPSKVSANISYLYVVATCTVSGELIRLEKLVGDDWGDGLQVTEDTRKNGEVLILNLKEKLEALGLEVRSGVMEED